MLWEENSWESDDGGILEPPLPLPPLFFLRCPLLFVVFPAASLFISPHLSPPVSRVHLLFSPPLFLSHLPSIISSVFPPHSSLSCLRGDSSPAPCLYCDSPYPLGSCIYLCGLLLAQVLGKIEILLPPSISRTSCLLLLDLGQSTCSETLL